MSFKHDKISLEKKTAFIEDYWLQTAVKRLDDLFSQNFLNFEKDDKKNRQLVWHLGLAFEKTRLDYLSQAVSSFGFHLVHEDLGQDLFQYGFERNPSLYLCIKRNSGLVLVTSYIETGKGHQRVRNLLTISVLSELQGLLKREFPQVPIYITFSSGDEKHLSGRKTMQQEPIVSIRASNLNLKSHFKNSLKMAEKTAIKTSMKQKRLIEREPLISLVYEHVLKGLNLSLIDQSFPDTLEWFVYQNVDVTLDRIAQTFQELTTVVSKERECNQASSHNFLEVKEDHSRKVIIRRKFNEEDYLYNSSLDDIEDMFDISTEERIEKKSGGVKASRVKAYRVSKDHAYLQSIKAYLHDFCVLKLHSLFSEQFTSAQQAKVYLLKLFKKLLKTINADNKETYESAMDTFMEENFSQEYRHTVKIYYHVPEPINIEDISIFLVILFTCLIACGFGLYFLIMSLWESLWKSRGAPSYHINFHSMLFSCIIILVATSIILAWYIFVRN